MHRLCYGVQDRIVCAKLSLSMRRVRDLTKPQPLTAREWAVGLFWLVFCGSVALWLIVSTVLFILGAL